MRINVLISVITILTLSGCGMLVGYPTTNFYVKNTSDKEVTAAITVRKYSSMSGPYEMTLPFVFPAGDSVLARQIGFDPKGEHPEGWFTEFVIDHYDSTMHNDPYVSKNWIKGLTKEGRTYYTFTINRTE